MRALENKDAGNQQDAYFAKNDQLNRYLEQLREEMHRAKRELMEKETYIQLITETSEGLQRAYRDIQTVYNLSQNIVKIRKQSQIIIDFIDAIAQILPLRAAAYFRYDALADDFFMLHDYRLDKEFREFIRKHQIYAYYRWAMNEKRPIVLPETLRFNTAANEEFSAVIIPVVQGSKIKGLLDAIIQKTPEEFSQRDFDLMIILANHAATAIENAHLYETMAIKTEVLDNIKNYLSNVLHGMSNGVLAVNEEGKIELINQNTENLFSLADVDPIGHHLLEVFSDSFGVKLHELYKKAVAQEGELSEEFEIKKDDGTRVPVSVKCNQLKDENGNIKGAIFVFQDMSETYELIKLRKIDRLKDQLISNISHELRTPLTAIKSFSEILLNYDENEETKKEFLSIINSESDRLTRLINNILDLSKLESGTAKWQLEPLNIEMVIDSAVDTLQSLLMQKKIKLVKKYAQNLPSVFADHDKLTQVIVNLVNNAIKFSPEGGKITIATELLPATKKRKRACIKVGVTDQGPGIPKKYLDVIFEKFGQVLETDDGNKPSGTGLGLTISREIIHHLGGRIWVVSKPGKGATFYFELPAMPEDADNVDEIYEKDKVTVVQPDKVITKSELESREVQENEKKHESEK